MSKIQLLTMVRWGVILAATCGGLVWATNPSGTSSILLGRGTFDAFHVERETDTAGQPFEIEAEARPGLDVATQVITFQSHGNSGWHNHPGPVFITVASGTMTFYSSSDPTCSPIVRTAGQGFLDPGKDTHIAVNETSAQAINVVTYFVPKGAPLRISQPQPPNCPIF